MYANARGVCVSHLQAAHFHGFITGSECQMDEAAHFLYLFFLDEIQRVKALDLGGDGAGEVGGIKMRDLAHAALAGEQVLPDLWRAPSYLPPFAFFSMYSTASFTVLIFSALSSGISMSNASSKAMTNSTVSRESAPRSSTKDALEVTSPSSTPNCSTMICFTFSSVAVAMSVKPSFVTEWLLRLDDARA